MPEMLPMVKGVEVLVVISMKVPEPFRKMGGLVDEDMVKVCVTVGLDMVWVAVQP